MSDLPATRTPAQLTPQQAFANDIERRAWYELRRLLGEEKGREATARVAIAFRQAAAVAKNPADLYRCSPDSVAACVALSAATGLMPGGPTPGVYLVPKGGTLQWWITHRGLMEMAAKAGYIVRSRPVFHGEVFEYEEGATLHVRHVPDLDADHKPDDLRGVLVQVYRAADMTRLDAIYVSRSDIEKRRKSSQMATSGPWKDWYVEMALKTAVKYAAARGSIRFQPADAVALEQDDAHNATNAVTVEQVAHVRPSLGMSGLADAVGAGDEMTDEERAAIVSAEINNAEGQE